MIIFRFRYSRRSQSRPVISGAWLAAGIYIVLLVLLSLLNLIHSL